MTTKYKDFSFDRPGYMILARLETYTRTASGKAWKKSPDELEKKPVSNEWYTNYVSAVPFFNNFGGRAYCRAYNGYQCAGFLPSRVITVNPDATVKKEARFRFVNRDRMEKAAGWREKHVMDNATAYNLEYIPGNPGGRELLTLYTTEEGSTSSAEYDITNGKWVG